MTSPAVTEVPRRLEPVSRDTFLDALANRTSAPGTHEPVLVGGLRAAGEA